MLNALLLMRLTTRATGGVTVLRDKLNALLVMRVTTRAICVVVVLRDKLNESVSRILLPFNRIIRSRSRLNKRLDPPYRINSKGKFLDSRYLVS